MGIGVGQVGALAYHGNMDTPAQQSPEWHIEQAPAAPMPLPVRDTTTKM